MVDHEAPLDGMLTLRIDGDRVTKVGIEQGETISLEMESDDE